MAIRGGYKAARNSAIGCACLLAVIEGVGIGFQRMMAESSTKLEVCSILPLLPCITNIFSGTSPPSTGRVRQDWLPSCCVNILHDRILFEKKCLAPSVEKWAAIHTLLFRPKPERLGLLYSLWATSYDFVCIAGTVYMYCMVDLARKSHRIDESII